MSVYQRFSRFSYRRQEKALKQEIQQEKSENAISFRKKGLICGVLAIYLVVRLSWARTTVGSIHSSETVHKKGSNGVSSYELYPFLVDSKAVATSVAKSRSTSDAVVIAVLSKPTLPGFPVIPRLEGCQLVYIPSEPPRNAEDWRPKFWIPSYPGSGASNPTMKGNLLREIIERLFFGANKINQKPVKDYHMSMKDRLKRCKGISETIGCTTTHPLTPVLPEGQTNEFRPEVIFSIRNPATAFPISLAYKHMQYHGGTEQADEDEWRKMRDQYFEESFQGWINQIRVWRATAEASSYYFTSIYVPFEDLVSTDASRGIAIIRDLSDAISGRNAFETKDETRQFFETTTEGQDYECIWYRKAKTEWAREQTIIGNYIPAYTLAFKDLMVRELRAFADEVEKDPIQGDSDAALVSLLRRYALQIEKYLRVEEQ